MRGKAPVCRIPVYNSKGEQHSYFDLPRDGGKGWFKQGVGNSGIFLPGRLPQPGEHWIVAEGPKDPSALHALGFNALGMNTSKLAAKYARLLRGVDVLIFPDLDRAGEDGAKTTAARLHGVARSVHIATLPAEFKEKDGADVRDVPALKDGESLLRQAMTDAREWKPTPEIAESDGVPSLLNPRERTDTANAARFANLHSKGILFAGPWSEWLLWDGQRWPTIKPVFQATLLAGQYRFSPLRRIHGYKDTYEIWHALDSLVLKAMAIVLQRRLAPQLSQCCHHLAGHAGAKGAVRAVAKQLSANKFVFRTDVKSYYASIDHQVLLDRLANVIGDRRVLALLRGYLCRTVYDGGFYEDVQCGIALGCPLSPLMGALYLSELDHAMEARGLFYARFMDDWVILSPSRWKLRNAIAIVNPLLE